MDLPGEKLLIKLWETLSEKGIGAILRPGQSRREGIVGIEMRRAEMLTLAQTERDVKDIQDGTKTLEDFALRIKFSERSSASRISTRTEPYLSLETFIDESMLRANVESARKEINVAKAILHAEESIGAEEQEPGEEKINDDWLFRWRDYAADVSSGDMQQLWGRLLAGEVKVPGSFSLRSLDFLRNLSQPEAQLIEKASKFIIDGLLWTDGNIEEHLSFNECLELETLGVLSGVSTGGLKNTTGSAAPDRWIKVMRGASKCLIVTHTDLAAVLVLSGYRVTMLGEQIVSLGRVTDDLDFLSGLGKHIVSKGFKVLLGDYTYADGVTRYRNGVPVE